MTNFPENPILGPFWTLSPNLDKNKSSWKRVESVFKYSNYLPSCQNLKETNMPFLRKMPNWQMDRQTDRQQWFCRTLCWMGVVQKLWHILKSHKLRSTFYTENTLYYLLCNQNDWVGIEDKNNTVFEIEDNNYKAVYFNESKWSLELGSRKICKKLWMWKKWNY